ncbi:MAG: hypothetical protein HC836_16520 [Richelia sp. RM2_1_2]|nr:hypothetical protein [Richelia sp. RM2_1_2]
MCYNFSQDDKNKIIEDLVITKFTSSFLVRKYSDNYYVIINGFIFPYRIFLVGLFSYGLWKLNYTKTDWVRINQDLISLWAELNVGPKNIKLFTPNKKRELGDKVPTTFLKKTLNNLEVDENILKFFNKRSHDTEKYEAILYMLEKEYNSLAK